MSERADSPLPVLTFHAVEDSPSVTSFAPQLFSRGLKELRDHGYQALGLEEAAARLRGGDPVPKRSLVLTFDDGYKSVFDEAFPILKRNGMKATVFVTVGTEHATKLSRRLPSLCGRQMLSWGEIREMAQSGISFGAHTLTHPDLTRLTPERIEAEIVGSKSIIEDFLGAPVTCFAYPFGRHNRQIREAVRQHFLYACTDMVGLLGNKSDPYAIDRVDAYFLRTERLFRLLLTSAFPWYVMARRALRRVRRAVVRR